MEKDKKRIDVLLVEKGFVESRNRAQRLVMAGEVKVNGELVHKPAEKYSAHSLIELVSKPKYLSRGGFKLEKAIKEFSLDLKNKVCADIGASTGGFTDCLLQHGATKVYAIDVGYGQLHQKLREDPRVYNMERTNIRKTASLPDPIDLITIDVSFISLKLVLPIIKEWELNNNASVIALIKPQFEVGRKIAAKGKGVVHDEKDRQQAVNSIMNTAREEGFIVNGITESPIKGPKGNVEYLLYLKWNC